MLINSVLLLAFLSVLEVYHVNTKTKIVQRKILITLQNNNILPQNDFSNRRNILKLLCAEDQKIFQIRI